MRLRDLSYGFHPQILRRSQFFLGKQVVAMSENGYQTLDAESSASFSALPKPDFADACYWEELEGLAREEAGQSW